MMRNSAALAASAGIGARYFENFPEVGDGGLMTEVPDSGKRRDRWSYRLRCNAPLTPGNAPGLTRRRPADTQH
jgi:hypothetical protein